MNLKMLTDWKEHPFEASVKVLSRSELQYHVKTQPVLQVSSWSQGLKEDMDITYETGDGVRWEDTVIKSL